MRSSIIHLFVSLAWPALIPLLGAYFWLQSSSAPDSMTALWRWLPPLLLVGAGVGLLVGDGVGASDGAAV